LQIILNSFLSALVDAISFINVNLNPDLKVKAFGFFLKYFNYEF